MGTFTILLQPLLPALLGLIACLWWWRVLTAPVMFTSTAILCLFGLQTIISSSWDIWQSTGANNVIGGAPTEQQVIRTIDRLHAEATTKAFILLVLAAPFLSLLRRRF